MALFSDDFERANGAPGNGWSDLSFVSSISGGALVFSNSGLAYNTNTYEEHRHDVTVHMSGVGSSGARGGPSVRLAAGVATGFSLVVKGTSRPYTLAINNPAGVAAATLASVSLDVNLPPMYALRLVWEDGHLSGYFNDTLMLETDSALYFNQRYAGLTTNASYAPILDFSCVLGTAPGLSVDPAVIPNYGACSTVTLTGTNTAWTPGTPGSPTFTVNHGTISAQTVTSATSATLTYCPGSWLGAILFADSSTGQSAGAVVTSDPAVVPPGTSYLFTPQAVAMVNNTAGESYIERLLKPNTSVDVEGVASLELDTVLGKVALNTGATVTPTSLPSATLLYTLYRLVNGGYPSAVGPFTSPTYETLDAGLTDHRDRLDALITSNHWTLGDVITELAGEGVKTHLDLYNAIGAISGGSNAEVLDAISAAKGDPLATIKAVLDSLFVLSTVNNYTLATVKTWVEAVRGSGLPTVKSVMDKLGGSSNTIETRIDALSDLIATETTIQSIINIAVGALSGREGSSIASVLDAIDALPAPTPPTPQLAAPVWPGDGLATLGTSHALADGLIVDGPMHGLIVTIDGHPSGAGKYAFGSVMSWQHCGAVVFADDSGHYERAESFGLPSQIITPRSMAKAASATVRLNGGWSGTIRGWTVTP